MKFLALVLVTLALAGCGDDQKERLEIADVNSRNAIVKAEELSSRIDELEARIDELEAKLDE